MDDHALETGFSADTITGTACSRGGGKMFIPDQLEFEGMNRWIPVI